MIEIYTGRVGASKTYHGTLAVCRELAKGRVVATNIPLKVPQLLAYIERRMGVTVDPSALMDLNGLGAIPDGYKPDRKGWSHSAARRSNRQDRAIDPKPGDMVEKVSFMHIFVPPGAQIVIDEAHTWFAQDTKSDTPDETFQWMTQSRHQGNDIILITQDADNMDRRFKRLAGFIWVFRDMQTLGIPGVGKWPFPQFKVTQLDAVSRNVMFTKIVPKDPEIYAIYDSYAMNANFARAPIPPVAKPKKRKRKTMKWYVLLLILGALYLVANGTGINPWAPIAKKESEQPATPVGTVVAQPTAPAAAPVVAAPGKRVQECVVVRTGDYGDYSATSVGPVYKGAITALGVVVTYSSDRRIFTTRAADGTEYRVLMVFPSEVRHYPDIAMPRVVPSVAGAYQVETRATTPFPPGTPGGPPKIDEIVGVK